ncbi:MAG: holo-ACP synthase [Anaerolineales bacterium]|nr:holo-ACP synthase [Anaerolineales bacterium]
MTQLATGIDLIEVKRIQEAIERHGDPFLKRIFSAAELVEAGGSPASLAARFAAKEATAKALGCGIGPIGWQEVEVLRDAAGQPRLNLHGAAAQLAAERGLTSWSISLSHTREHAIAMVVGAG